MANEKISSEDRLWAVASYFWVLSLVALAARKNNDFVRFHANQGAFLFVCSLILMIVPLIGWLVAVILYILALVALIKAAMGEKWPLPYFADIAEKFGNWLVKTLNL